MTTPREGTLQVWNVVNPPSKPSHHPVPTPEAAVELIRRMAAQQLENPRIFANAFGLEVFENGEWSEWYSEDGMDIGEYEEFLEGEQA